MASRRRAPKFTDSDVDNMVNEIVLMLKPLKEQARKMNDDAEEIGKKLHDLTEGGTKHDFKKEEDKKKKLIDHRGALMGIMAQAVTLQSNLQVTVQATVQNILRQIGSAIGGAAGSIANAIAGVTTQITQAVQTVASIISQYIKQLKVDSIVVILSVSPSVTVTLK